MPQIDDPDVDAQTDAARANTARPLRNITIRSLSAPNAANESDPDVAARQAAWWMQPQSPTGEVNVVPVAHDPFDETYRPLVVPAGGNSMVTPPDAFGAGARSLLTIPTRRGELWDSPEAMPSAIARSIASDPYADPINGPSAGAASVPQAWQTMGVVRPSLLERAADNVASFLGGGFRDHPAYQMVKEGKWGDLDAYLGALHSQGKDEVADAVAGAVRRALTAPYDPDFAAWQRDPAAFERAAQTSFDLASSVTGPGIGRASTAADTGLGTFGGRIGARNLPKAQAAFERAEQLDAAGVNNDDIWRETGWRRGKEGQWEFEIPDGGLQVKTYDPAVHESPDGFRVSDVIHHPELEQAYGDYLNDKLRLRFDRNFRGLAYSVDLLGLLDLIGLKPPIGHTYLPGEIVLNRTQVHSLLHELNHMISKLEGRSRGGIGQIEGESRGGGWVPVLQDVRRRLAGDGFSPQQIENALSEYYMSLADEVRSRVVERRYGFPRERLAAEPPSRTARDLGYPERLQIVPAGPSQARTPERRHAKNVQNIIDRIYASGILPSPE